jgi:hypothetical protein
MSVRDWDLIDWWLAVLLTWMTLSLLATIAAIPVLLWKVAL